MRKEKKNFPVTGHNLEWKQHPYQLNKHISSLVRNFMFFYLNFSWGFSNEALNVSDHIQDECLKRWEH